MLALGNIVSMVFFTLMRDFPCFYAKPPTPHFIAESEICTTNTEFTVHGNKTLNNDYEAGQL